MFQTISIGPVTFHGYGLIIGMAIMVGWWWAERLWRQQIDKKTNFDMVGAWAVVGGVIGARLYHVVDYWWYYQNRLTEIVAVWQGGLAIWGAIMGGGLGLLWLSKRKKISLQLILDILATVLPLSQAIGRWGNWVNFELYGKPTSRWWGWWIPPEHRPEKTMEIARYHPLFLYESLLLLGLFLLIYKWRQKWVIGSGMVMGTYLVGYGLIRYLLEPLRLEPFSIYRLPVAQLISVLAMIVGIGLILRVRLGYEK